jgi:TetR/AcrR family transcriptional regulator, ethionamide resistance regulator
VSIIPDSVSWNAAMAESRTSKPQAPRGRRRAPTKGDRREQALLDALERLLAQQPVTRLSVDQIATEAGLSRTAFYFYFSSKEAAVMRLVERSVAAIWQVPDSWLLGDDPDPAGSLSRSIAAAVRVWEEHGAVLGAVVESASYDRELWEFWRRTLEGFIDAAAARIARDQKAGRTRPDLDPRATAEALCWMNERYLYAYLAGGATPKPGPDVRRTLTEVWLRVLYEM